MRYQITSYELLKQMLQQIPQDDSCLEWPRGRNKLNYGQLQTWNREREFLVHRQAWVETFGPIPGELFVCHHCDNPPCFRPSHLFLGDQDANMNDCARKQRVIQAKLNPDSVRQIRDLRKGGMKMQPLADRFGVSRYVIWTVVSGKQWHWVD